MRDWLKGEAKIAPVHGEDRRAVRGRVGAPILLLHIPAAGLKRTFREH